MTDDPKDVIRRTVTVPVGPERAFAVFTDELDSWWPQAFTWAADVLETIAIEPREGGRCFERGPHGFEVDWGRVLVWEPPRRLIITWQISPQREPEPNPARSSEVEVRFEPEGEGRTRVELEHRNFDNHGEGSDAYRAAMAEPEGWSYILDRYVAAFDGR
jgi:uncharacterized protein YndB with AHSA1/START domain